jgi:hypothetical protein
MRIISFGEWSECVGMHVDFDWINQRHEIYSDTLGGGKCPILLRLRSLRKRHFDLTLVPSGLEVVPGMDVSFRFTNGSSFVSPVADVVNLQYGAYLYQQLYNLGNALALQLAQQTSGTWQDILMQEGSALGDLSNYLCYGTPPYPQPGTACTNSEWSGIAQVTVPHIQTLVWEFTPECDQAIEEAAGSQSLSIGLTLLFPPAGAAAEIVETIFHFGGGLYDAYEISNNCQTYQ